MSPKSFMVGKVRVRTFTPTPPDFNAITATAKKLLIHGIPPKPDKVKEPELHKSWMKVFAKPLRYITPEFTSIPNIQQRPAKKRRRIDNASTSNNWSGAVVQSASPFQWVMGNWTVPDVYNFDGKYGRSYSAAWIGIDGWGSNDVLQAGTMQYVFYDGSYNNVHTYAWWEWYPETSVRIENFIAARGDSMACLICASSDTTATIYLSNLNSGAYTVFSITAPSGTRLVGNCAEWIMERPNVDGEVSTLPNYGMIFFDTACAGTRHDVFKAKDGVEINMVDNNQILSTGRIVGDEVVRCTFSQ